MKKMKKGWFNLIDSWINKWMNSWKNEESNECINWRVHKWFKISINGWMKERNEWICEVNRLIKDWVNGWMNGWMKERRTHDLVNK